MTDGISKADFARTMGVDRSQVTRWTQLGMPTLDDGNVPAARAAEWVRGNVQSYARARRSIGAREMRAAQVQHQQASFEEIARLGLWLLTQRIPGEAARVAIQAGATPQVAYTIYRRLQRRGPEVANELRAHWMGLDEGEIGAFPDVGLDLDPPDWAALARAARVRFDPAAWERGAAERFGEELPPVARAPAADSAEAD